MTRTERTLDSVLALLESQQHFGDSLAKLQGEVQQIRQVRCLVPPLPSRLQPVGLLAPSFLLRCLGCFPSLVFAAMSICSSCVPRIPEGYSYLVQVRQAGIANSCSRSFVRSGCRNAGARHSRAAGGRVGSLAVERFELPRWLQTRRIRLCSRYQTYFSVVALLAR